MVFSFSPWRKRPAKDSNSGPSAAGGTAKPICAALPAMPGLAWPDLWRRRRAARPVSRWKVLPSRFRANKRHLFTPPRVAFLEMVHWGSRKVVALDHSALFGDGGKFSRLRLTLGPLVGVIALMAVILVLSSILLRGFSENGFRLGSQ